MDLNSDKTTLYFTGDATSIFFLDLLSGDIDEFEISQAQS